MNTMGFPACHSEYTTLGSSQMAKMAMQGPGRPKGQQGLRGEAQLTGFGRKVRGESVLMDLTGSVMVLQGEWHWALRDANEKSV